MSFKLAIILLAVINVIGFYPYREKIKIVNIVIIGAIILFLSMIRDTPDINNYYLRFSADFFSVKDAGFNTLARVIYRMHWDYYQFQTFIYVICISLISQGLIRTVEKRTLVYVLYMAYPFLLNAVQLRNFVAASIFVFTVCVCSIDNNSVRQKIKWCILMLIASSMHILIFAFVPYIFVIDKEKILRTMAVFFLTIAGLFYVFPKEIIAIIGKVFSLIDKSSRVSQYLVISTRYGGLVMIIEAILLFYCANKLYKVCWHYSLFDKDSNAFVFCTFVERLMLYSLIFTPLYVLHGDFFRLVQNTTILLYGIFSITYNVDKKGGGGAFIKIKKEMLMPTVLVIFFVIYHVFTLWIGSYDNVVKPLISSVF